MSLAHDDRLRFGVCYYPDHWPESRWAEDMALMKQLGLDCFRWGEGSWSTFEPEEGVYDWSLADKVLAMAADNGLGVILGTPTYAAPAWLIEQYPESLAQRADGSPWYPLSRRCYDYTNADYRRCCNAIVKRMAERFAGDKRVWAWQIDNEIYCHLNEFYGESMRQAFQEWCAKRYVTVEALNTAWGLAFWSGQVSHFGQVSLPGPTPAHVNQHQAADYQQFLSDLGIDFLQNQIDAIKAVDPTAIISHNYPFPPIDRAELCSRLETYGQDHYPAFVPIEERPQMGLNYGRFRAHTKRLWSLEQQSSQIGQQSYQMPSAAPGELSVVALQSIGHGCDLLSWFRWRTFPAAQEITWGGLLPSWGEPGLHFSEAQELIAELKPQAATIAATKPQVSVARLLNFRQDLLHKVEGWIGERIGEPEIGRGALCSLALNENHISIGELNDSYTIALVPQAVGWNAVDVESLEAWVRAGGTAIVGPLAGHRDADFHAAVITPPPGPWGSLTGTKNAEATTWDAPLRIHGADGGGVIEAGHYAEILELQDEACKTIARYASGWLAGQVAICERSLGVGRVIHSGVALSDAVLTWLWHNNRLPVDDNAVATHNQAAEVLVRVGDGYRLYFALNHGEGPVVVQVRRGVRDLLTGQAVPSSFTLEAHGWRVLREDLDPALAAV